MKTNLAALTVLLLAGASAPALAQDKDRSELRAEAMGDREAPAGVGRGPERGSRGQPTREFRDAPRPPSPPEAARPREAPRPPEATGGERRPRVERGGGERRGGGLRPRLDLDGDDVNQGLSPADQVDREDRDELREGRRWIGRGVQARPQQGQDGQPPVGGRPRERNGDRDRGDRPGRRPDGDRDRDGRRPDGDRDGRRWDGDRDGRDGRGDGDRRWDRDRDGRDGDRRWDRDGRRPPPNHPRWDGRRYPHSYNSRHRYRGHYWRPPAGFYVRLWSFGDVLPRGWYAQDYRILDWWMYDLPVPPPGYDWVRVGYDALLVDQFSGRVIQVVRLVFW